MGACRQLAGWRGGHKQNGEAVKYPVIKNEEGFTLIEVMVGFVIMAGAIIMTFQVFGDGLRSLNASQLRAQETEIAQQQIDILAISENLTEGTTVISADGQKLRVTTTQVKGFEREQFFVPRAFKVSVFRDDGKDLSEPILETILIARPTTP